ncbi:hypothetical protein GCM10025865_08290 [Paraoerskovia sediminicola]|uniref:Uncharacterized protein n=1 Tax=Paraoerskovia sediminicola TaxID=1138587 RepID=A0ABM8G0D5_9CELL|nr:hypothetical protein [Paraoerskovia sediminicola]BDZ41530.1 hypothetical protein GCM10025865_08290 [Paraoerskovia sediminicola]
MNRRRATGVAALVLSAAVALGACTDGRGGPDERGAVSADNDGATAGHLLIKGGANGLTFRTDASEGTLVSVGATDANTAPRLGEIQGDDGSEGNPTPSRSTAER